MDICNNKLIYSECCKAYAEFQGNVLKNRNTFDFSDADIKEYIDDVYNTIIEFKGSARNYIYKWYQANILNVVDNDVL